jgi:predicted Kef-type K+ transport protein/mannitol/fructose-specific phosphotransferase system IIA component (Ntr-type)
MHGDLDLIPTLAAALTAALAFGYVTHRLGLSPIVGYLLAGVLIGPHTPGFIGNVHIAQQLAEIGVILLMFGVGLHFHLKDLLSVKGVAIPGAIGQSLIATVLAVVVFAEFDIPWQTGAVLGMAMAVASTVVLMRVLMDADILNSPQGHVAVGWLIVEDIFTVVLLVLIPVLGRGLGAEGAMETALAFWPTLGLAILKLGALIAILLLGGSRVIPWAMVHVARLRSRELFTLTVLVISIAIAAASYLFFGASMALGAFLAGMVVAQSPVSHQAAADALPMRDAFAVLFFVSVGMLFDPGFLITQPLMVVAALGIILLAKPLTALIIVALLGHSGRTALTVAIGLAQIGEFSFILSELARQHGLMPEAGHNVLVAAAIISITLNPVLFRALPRIESWLKARPRLWQMLNGRAEPAVSLLDAMANGGVVLELAARSGVEAIRELTEAVPNGTLPPGTEREHIAHLALARQEHVSTDFGNGVAIPHAQCQGLKAPIVVFGRSARGLVFSPGTPELVHLVFLLITSTEQPETQLTLLRHLAGLCREQSARDALKHAPSAGDVLSILDSLSREAPRRHEVASRSRKS